MKKLFAQVFVFFVLVNQSSAEITLSKIFADSMVLQRAATVHPFAVDLKRFSLSHLASKSIDLRKST